MWYGALLYSRHNSTRVVTCEETFANAIIQAVISVGSQGVYLILLFRTRVLHLLIPLFGRAGLSSRSGRPMSVGQSIGPGIFAGCSAPSVHRTVSSSNREAIPLIKSSSPFPLLNTVAARAFAGSLSRCGPATLSAKARAPCHARSPGKVSLEQGNVRNQWTRFKGIGMPQRSALCALSNQHLIVASEALERLGMLQAQSHEK